MHSPFLQPGALLDGRYRIEEPIGSGGHAFIYRAIQEGIERPVALKILKSSMELEALDLPEAKREELIKRFEQEAQLVSQLRDPSTITVFDYGATDDGLLYMVCEYVEGETLKDVLERHGALEPARVVAILKRLLMSLQEAHAIGVLHRDVKPDNIMVYTHLGRRDQLKLLDFGVAKTFHKMAGEISEELTAEGKLVGTPRYVAPERIQSKTQSPASDIYSLGMVAYEMLTGTRPMAEHKGIHALRAQITDPSVTLPDDLDLPDNLRAIVDRMMDKTLSHRYQLAGQVLEDLEVWQQDAPLPSRRDEARATERLEPAVATTRSADGAAEITDRLDAMGQRRSASSTDPSVRPRATKEDAGAHAASERSPDPSQHRRIILILAAGIGLTVFAILAFVLFVALYDARA